MPNSTIEYRYFLERFFCFYGISSVVDFGCADWQFSKFIPWGEIAYTGYDIVPSIIAENEKYCSDTIKFQIVSEDLEELRAADLLIMKDVLQHLPNDLIFDLNGTCKKV